MPIDLEKLLQLRPAAFHTTGQVNFASIRDHRALISTQGLVGNSKHTSLLTGRRFESTTIRVDGRQIQIRDQLPLRPGSLLLENGATLQGYLDELNRRVFLWPGTMTRPVSRGQRHFEHYNSKEGVVILRMSLCSLLVANPTAELFVERCNSGAARHHGGQPVERGPKTFARLGDADFRPSEVVEISFIDRVELPPGTEFSTAIGGPWKALMP